MNLTKQYPRSPYAKAGGYVMLGRTVDKARAKLENALGEYIYDCPLDQRLFEFLDINADSLLEAVKTAPTDDVVLQWVKSHQAPHTDAEIDAFNEKVSRLGPDDAESHAYFEQARKRVAPDRLELRSWFDLIEAEEGRLK
jgi:hypothetical protein